MRENFHLGKEQDQLTSFTVRPLIREKSILFNSTEKKKMFLKGGRRGGLSHTCIIKVIKVL